MGTLSATLHTSVDFSRKIKYLGLQSYDISPTSEEGNGAGEKKAIYKQ